MSLGEVVKFADILLLKNVWELRLHCRICDEIVEDQNAFLTHLEDHLDHLLSLRNYVAFEQTVDKEDSINVDDGIEESIEMQQEIEEYEELIEVEIEPCIEHDKHYKTIEMVFANSELPVSRASTESIQTIIDRASKMPHDETKPNIELVVVDSLDLPKDQTDNENIVTNVREEIDRSIPHHSEQMEEVASKERCLESENLKSPPRKRGRKRREYKDENGLPISKRKANSKTYICDICGKSVRDSQNFIVHRNRHLNIKPFSCEICGKTFVHSTELKSHMISHTNERKFKCGQCEVALKYPHQLRTHIRSKHSLERPHKCLICDKAFFNSQGLKEHMPAHSVERPFECEICFKTYPRKKALRNHRKLHGLFPG